MFTLRIKQLCFTVRIREKVKAFTHPTRSRGRYLRVLYLGPQGRLRLRN
jgi:hypothetical protein